jgi:hypothetical protein
MDSQSSTTKYCERSDKDKVLKPFFSRGHGAIESPRTPEVARHSTASTLETRVDSFPLVSRGPATWTMLPLTRGHCGVISTNCIVLLEDVGDVL